MAPSTEIIAESLGAASIRLTFSILANRLISDSFPLNRDAASALDSNSSKFNLSPAGTRNCDLTDRTSSISLMTHSVSKSALSSASSPAVN